MAPARRNTPQDPERATRIYYYWLLLAIFVEYARPASYFGFLRVPFLYSVIPILLFVVSCFVKELRPMKEIFADPLAKWILVFLVLIALGATHAPVTFYPFEVFKKTVGYAMLFIMIARIVTTRARMRGLFVTLLFAHLFLIAMNPKVLLEPEVRHYIVGATFLGDGNDFALSLCILIPCMIEVASSATSMLRRLAAWGGVGVLLLAIIASQSRGATLGMGCVLFYLWLRSNRKALSIAAIAVVGVIVMIYAPKEYFDRLGTIANYQSEGSAMGRVHAWQGAMRMMADNPLLGVGAGTFPQAYGTRYNPTGAPGGWLTAHSSYFLVIGEMGVPGILTFLILVFGGVRRNIKVRKVILARAGPEESEHPPAVKEAARMLYLTSAAMIGFAAAGTFLSAAYYPHVFLLTGLLIAARCDALATVGMTNADISGVRPRRRKAPVNGAVPEGQAPPRS
jgi:putative inorganic carbon (HCO3(-)) transporter